MSSTDPAPTAVAENVVLVDAGPAPKRPRKRRRAGWIITVVLLSLALVGTGALLAITFQRLEDARDVIDDQKELIDKKETFTASMGALVATASEFDGLLFGDVVPHARHESMAQRGWEHRWNAAALDRDVKLVDDATGELAALLAAAREQAATNASGTTYESVIDSLGGGFVASLIEDADSVCENGDVLACVFGEDPYTVHFDAADIAEPYMTDWLLTGTAYHEFAHVLQMTNPAPTDIALEAFGGDVETMADCFALTYLDGWTLDHEVWVSDVQYWEVSLGYGYTCDESQRQVIRDWYGSLGYVWAPISQ